MNATKLLCCAIVACTASSSISSAQSSERAVFVVRIGNDTLAVENAMFSSTRIDAVLLLKSPMGRITQKLELTPTGSVARSAIAFGRGVQGDSAMQSTALSVTGDSAAVHVEMGPMKADNRIGIPKRTVPFTNLSGTSLELILRMSRAIGGDTAQVPIIVGPGQLLTATVIAVGSDSAVVVIGGVPLRTRTDKAGHFLGATVPSQRLNIDRRDGDSPAGAWTPAPTSYAAPAGAPYTARDITLRAPAGNVLAGTLTQPTNAGATSVPAVVLITGSGAQDRDEALITIGEIRAFREIADTLSRRGIAVLRLDDRGVGGSDGGAAGATSADFADDIRAGVEWLRTQKGIDPVRIGLVGHSEGGMIAPMIAASDPRIRAIALIAGPAKSGREISAFQRRQAIDQLPRLTARQKDSLFAESTRQTDSAFALPGWWHFFSTYDPLATAKKVRTPTLILQGETDRQVTPEQAGVLADAMRKAGNTRVTVRLFPRLNHIMLDDPSGDPSGYAALRPQRVRKDILGVLADWLVTNLK
ncbi:MAG: alpha/beta fold hydrolase [Gemmatimonadota bacterium]